MVHEEAENRESVSSVGKLSRNPSSSSATQEDVFMELDSKRFEKPRSNTPMRRVSCISSFGRKASTDAGIRKENLNFGGRRFSMDLSRPRLSIASKRDRSLNKLYSEMDMGTRKAGDDTGTLVHDLELVQTSNITTSKRIDNLLNASAEMRERNRHVFPFRDASASFIPRRDYR
ncbi:uncharacterized protein LOC116288646 [Actinia tenebrosa]|uniref:Uncharacterized protein LOC116288646 n=1 Tax=Actinia tenebrosa TaxID=6105 RepID=A0A6P8H4Q4_ACTTE|nr:uncharacterized protein LOC116288646 [Actinia tenebrosa]